MNTTLLTLHLFESNVIFGLAVIPSVLLAAVSWMLVVKSSQFKILQRDHRFESSMRQELWNDLQSAVTHNKALLLEIDSLKSALRNTDVSLSGMIDHWRSKYNDLRDSLPKPQPRTPDGKFLKGSERLDSLRKHLIAGNTTDREHAKTALNINDVHKYIAKLEKEGFLVRKSRRKIAGGSHLTEYYLAPEKGPRHWAAQPVN